MVDDQINCLLAVMRLERQIKRLNAKWSRTTGLSLNELRILIYVQQHPKTQLQTIAKAFDISKASLAQNIGPLVDRHWLATKPTETDRRYRVLLLTPTGERMTSQLIAQLGPSLSTPQATKLLAVIEQLQRYMRKHRHE
ncbi:MarR family winged helix-turn-helix transcriptional regulator [Lactiplantibacillus fabifermentans]|uniref:HTH marR-type domain-containing protein n=2 Tax=Lactiplantibacillus fabifermentans TaxID=483011 RepID=A0A0R2NW21_9LACO|nr:MarR family winged helix-turn-helix transcriptional regulator [Lactiplantibacillus fabifermentans]ETY72724.1 MarR family transcriptional regulator [Lactiplantibacillus fabifermentans T30PCM01]KRO28013.1 hypothetical protein DY78_GL002722 [Lactiplantibacillus fabifermentans DSM 21115]